MNIGRFQAFYIVWLLFWALGCRGGDKPKNLSKTASPITTVHPKGESVQEALKIDNPLKLEHPLASVTTDWTQVCLGLLCATSHRQALLPDEKTQKYALVNLDNMISLMQTDIGLEESPKSVLGHGHMAVIRGQKAEFWDLRNKKKAKELKLTPGVKTDLIFTQDHFIVSGHGEENLEVYRWPDLKKTAIKGWQRRKSIEALTVRKGLLVALDNLLRRKYLLFFQGEKNGGLQFYKSGELPVQPNAHYKLAASTETLWVGFHGYSNRRGMGRVLVFLDASAFPEVVQKGKIVWEKARRADANEKLIQIRDLEFNDQGKLLIVADKGLGVLDPADGISADKIVWTPVENALEVHPMLDGKAAVIVKTDEGHLLKRVSLK